MLVLCIVRIFSPTGCTAWSLSLTTNRREGNKTKHDGERGVVTARVPGAHSRPRPPRPLAPGCAPPTPRPPSGIRAHRSAGCSPLAVSNQGETVSLWRRDSGSQRDKGLLLTNESFLTSYPHCLFLITSSSLGLQQLKGTPQASLEPTATLEQLK